MSETQSLAVRIDEDLKTAMRARDEVTKLTLRAVKTALTEASIGGTDRHAVDEAGALAVVQREAKRRRDAAAEYEKAGSPERAAQELAELAVLERYLPRQLTEAEIEEIARDVIAQVQAQSMADMGQVMSAIMPRVAGVADGRAVNQVIRKLLAAQSK